jgi:hypothetical protein
MITKSWLLGKHSLSVSKSCTFSETTASLTTLSRQAVVYAKLQLDNAESSRLGSGSTTTLIKLYSRKVLVKAPIGCRNAFGDFNKKTTQNQKEKEKMLKNRALDVTELVKLSCYNIFLKLR